jgi:uncharacterized protein involved in exopolysaccharide biosynthesis
MEDAETKLASVKSIAPQITRDLTLQRLAEFEATLEQTRAAIGETQKRIDKLTQQKAVVPSRLTTQVRRSDNQVLLQQLKTTLLNLELKRADLLTKYQASYQPVQEVEQQIADTRAALAVEESSPARDEVTDQNPTHAWILSELAKAESDLAGLQARELATVRTIATYKSNTRELEQNRIAGGDLDRVAKTAEESYLLYRRKGEEARISEALDKQRILNVAVTQSASVPAFPVHSISYYVLIGLALACFVAVGVIFAAEYMDPIYHTPQAVIRSLQLPVLAALPSPFYSSSEHSRSSTNGTDVSAVLDSSAGEREPQSRSSH